MVRLPWGAWRRDAFEIQAQKEGYGLQPVRKQRERKGTGFSPYINKPNQQGL
jgi:hypothetical protein